MRNRFRGHGADWFRRRRESRRLNVESATVDRRDVGGLRVDIEAFLAAPVVDYDGFDLDLVIAQRDFRARARRWLSP